LQSIPGVFDFEQGYARRISISIEGVEVNVIGLEDLLAAKRAAGRPQDLADVSTLEKVREKECSTGPQSEPSKNRERDDP